jgi:hypothetical protein
VLSEAFATLELSQHLLNLITEFPALISLDEVPIAPNPVWLKEWARMEFWSMLSTSSRSTSQVGLALGAPGLSTSAGGSPIGGQEIEPRSVLFFRLAAVSRLLGDWRWGASGRSAIRLEALPYWARSIVLLFMSGELLLGQPSETVKSLAMRRITVLASSWLI